MALIEHLEKLRHFHKVAQARSFNEAALTAGLSQAGLSKSIAALESALDVALFVRTPQGLVLTSEGQKVLTSTQKILSEATNLETQLRSMKAVASPKKFRIGMYDSIAVYFFDDVLRYLQAIYQDVRIELTVHTSTELWRRVSEGSVDLAMGVNFNGKQGKTEEFFALFEDHYSFYTSAKMDEVSPEAPFLLHPLAEDDQGVTVEQTLAAMIKKRGAHRIYNFETIKTLTIQGMGIGVLPTQVAKPLLRQQLLKPVEIPKVKHLFGKHQIGFLAGAALLQTHREFALDIFRLGQQWSKSE